MSQKVLVCAPEGWKYFRYQQQYKLEFKLTPIHSYTQLVLDQKLMPTSLENKRLKSYIHTICINNCMPHFSNRLPFLVNNALDLQDNLSHIHNDIISPLLEGLIEDYFFQNSLSALGPETWIVVIVFYP